MHLATFANNHAIPISCLTTSPALTIGGHSGL